MAVVSRESSVDAAALVATAWGAPPDSRRRRADRAGDGRARRRRIRGVGTGDSQRHESCGGRNEATLTTQTGETHAHTLGIERDSCSRTSGLSLCGEMATTINGMLLAEVVAAWRDVA